MIVLYRPVSSTCGFSSQGGECVMSTVCIVRQSVFSRYDTNICLLDRVASLVTDSPQSDSTTRSIQTFVIKHLVMPYLLNQPWNFKSKPYLGFCWKTQHAFKKNWIYSFNCFICLRYSLIYKGRGCLLLNE